MKNLVENTISKAFISNEAGKALDRWSYDSYFKKFEKKLHEKVEKHCKEFNSELKVEVHGTPGDTFRVEVTISNVLCNEKGVYVFEEVVDKFSIYGEQEKDEF